MLFLGSGSHNSCSVLGDRGAVRCSVFGARAGWPRFWGRKEYNKLSAKVCRPTVGATLWSGLKRCADSGPLAGNFSVRGGPFWAPKVGPFFGPQIGTALRFLMQLGPCGPKNGAKIRAQFWGHAGEVRLGLLCGLVVLYLHDCLGPKWCRPTVGATFLSPYFKAAGRSHFWGPKRSPRTEFGFNGTCTNVGGTSFCTPDVPKGGPDCETHTGVSNGVFRASVRCCPVCVVCSLCFVWFVVFLCVLLWCCSLSAPMFEWLPMAPSAAVGVPEWPRARVALAGVPAAAPCSKSVQFVLLIFVVALLLRCHIVTVGECDCMCVLVMQCARGVHVCSVCCGWRPVLAASELISYLGGPLRRVVLLFAAAFSKVVFSCGATLGGF